MMAALVAGIARASEDENRRVIVLGAAGKVFCAGHDRGELRASDEEADHDALFERCSSLMMAIGACRLPVIARVQGAAVAAGCQLVASCDLAFAADTARVAVPGVNPRLFFSPPPPPTGRPLALNPAP